MQKFQVGDRVVVAVKGSWRGLAGKVIEYLPEKDMYLVKLDEFHKPVRFFRHELTGEPKK